MEAFNVGFGLTDEDPDPQEGQNNRQAEEVVRGKGNIYEPNDKGTALHRAIKSGNQSTVDSILEIYQGDFEKVKNYLVSKYQWNVKDKIWLRKTILVATSDNQCHSAKQLEKSSVPGEDLTQAIFVLLQNPEIEESVAVLHPNNTNRLEVFRFIRELIPNGFLTWNYTGLDGKQETLIETAASCARNSIIARLLELGAELGPPNHNPLLTACQHSQNDTISYLLNEHFDDFDCSMRDESQRNAFIVLMQRRNLEMMDFVFKKMIAYRQKYYGETESEAFNSIFRYEDEELSNLSCLTYVGTGPIRDRVSEYVAHYKLDLSYQWKGVSILVCLLGRKMALEYCYEEIRKNPKLLEMVVDGDVSVLHECIRLGALDILNEMYESKPEIKVIFESDPGIAQLQTALYYGRHETIRFILDHHKDFLFRELDKLKNDVIFSPWREASFYETYAGLLSEYFPELSEELEEAKKRIPAYHAGQDLEQAFSKEHITYAKSSFDPLDSHQSPSSIRGINGATLLHYAVEKDDQEMFTRMLEAGCDFNALDNEGNHPVHYVKCTAMFNFLIERHLEGHSLVHRTNSAGLTVLHKACGLYGDQKTDVDLVERIIECGADVNQLTNDGDSVVHKTVRYNVLDVLLKHNVNLEVVNDAGISAFQHHLSSKNTWMAQTLFPLVHKLPSFKEYAHNCLAPFMYTNRDFFSCDYQDFLEANPETTKLIFDSLYNHSREKASKLFNKACGSAHNFIAKKFLEFDYDLDYNYNGDRGYPAIVGLLSYMERDNVEIVKRLLEKGVDLEIRNQWGRNALLCLVSEFRWAKWYGHDEEMVQLLLDKGARINASDDDGNTSLHHAFANNEFKLVELLARNGADLLAKNKTGKIPVEMGCILIKELFYFMV